jgi:carbonic anhydrase/acetyltransferase-like protein (isoleucine patch superfamily)
MTIHPARDADFWPLHQDSPVGDQLIAGRSLLELQQEQAGSIENAHQLANAWITGEDWQALAEQAAPAVLKSSNGDTLAWTGNEQPDDEATVLSASEASLLIRYPWEFIQVNEQLVSQLGETSSEGEISPAAHIDGVVHLGEGSRILPGVVVEGNAVIGKNCKVGPNCYLRGSTTIGDNCHVGQAVEIKNSIIGHNTSIGHLSYVGDSVIGNDVNFGAGTITSNLRHDGSNHLSRVREGLVDTGRRKFGTVVGDGTHTGILTAIYPGRKLGPGSQTLPNQTVKRDLTG